MCARPCKALPLLLTWICVPMTISSTVSVRWNHGHRTGVDMQSSGTCPTNEPPSFSKVHTVYLVLWVRFTSAPAFMPRVLAVRRNSRVCLVSYAHEVSVITYIALRKLYLASVGTLFPP